MLDNCEVLACTADFWQFAKDFYEESVASFCPRKWAVLAGLDKKRL